MKKPALLILSLSAMLTLASCTVPTDTPPSSSDSGSSDASSEKSSSSETSSAISESSSETSSEEAVKTAKVKAVYNPESQAKASVYAGDTIATEGTITFVDKESNGNYDYQIYFNGTIADMSKGTDGITYSYDYKVAADSEVTIGFSKKSETSSDGYTLTFEQGPHYTIFGITSGQKYNPYTEYNNDDTSVDHDVWFTVIPEDGYYLNEVRTKTEDSDSSDDSDSSTWQYNYRNGCTLSSLDEDTTILVDVQKGSKHTISYIGNDDVDDDNSFKPKTFVGGSQVAFSFLPKSGFKITSVRFKSKDDFGAWDDCYDCDVLRTDFSKYVVIMPDEDIQIDINSGEIVTLSLAKDDRITNVSFYDGYQGSEWNDDYTELSLIDEYKVTDYVLGSEEPVIAAFNVVGDYKVKGLVDFSEDDYYVMGKTVDGRYAIRFSPYGKDPASVDLAAIHKVILDSSSTMVDLSLNWDNPTDYTVGDTVYFNLPVKEDYESDYRVKSVYACYNGQEILINYDDNWSCYQFDMPDYDVTIKVVMYEPVKTTVSYANNAGNLVSSVSLRGKISGTTTGDATSSSNFEEGEMVTIEVDTGSDHSKTIKAYYTTSDGTKTEITGDKYDGETYWNRDVYFGTYSGHFYVPAGGATVTLEAGDDVDSVNLFYKTDDAITFYKSEDASDVWANPTIYPMDVFYFTVGKTVADGEKLSVEAYAGEDLLYLDETTIGDKTAYKVKVRDEESITIKVSVLKSYNFSAKTTDGENVSSSCFEDGDGNMLSLTDGKILEGTLFKLSWSWEDYYKITSITIGGGEPKTKEGNWGYTYYVVTGDVEITLAVIATDAD